jgi:hypothetical protein
MDTQNVTAQASQQSQADSPPTPTFQTPPAPSAPVPMDPRDISVNRIALSLELQALTQYRNTLLSLAPGDKTGMIRNNCEAVLARMHAATGNLMRLGGTGY